jgi:non-specific serine/threonine protein kinase
MNTATRFGDVLRRYRLAAGLTQDELAERAGLSAHGISDLERGARRFPQQDTVARLSQALGLEASQRAELQAAGRRLANAGAVGQDSDLSDPVARPSATAAVQARLPRTNLPVEITSFVGRESELREVTRLLGATRLLTLVGAGGSGKTRLAVRVATEFLEMYDEGVWLVDLAPLAQPHLVPHAAAAAVGVREQPGQALLETLVDSLRPRQLLLVLDNCEHLIDACAQLTDALLRRCSGVQILATSRQPLGLAGETTWRVPPLRAVNPEHLPAVAGALTQYEAVRLFVDRALAVQPSFRVSNENAPAVAQICHRLDGLPLAIELAAARVNVLAPEQIAERLDDRFELLTGGNRTALPRQKTLRALVDWSYELLSDDEQRLFRRVSVFAGAWTLEPAEAIAADDTLQSNRILDVLAGLVDKSLVAAEDQSGGRMKYRILETLREYAAEQLRLAGEEGLVRDRHLRWYLALAERAEPELWEPDQAMWFGVLESEHDNFRAALDWSVRRSTYGLQAPDSPSGGTTEPGTDGEDDLGEAGLRLAAALSRWWYLRGHFAEGRAYLTALLPQVPAPGPARSRGLSAAAILAFFAGDQTSLRTFAQEALVVSQDCDDPHGRALALLIASMAADVEGDPVRALPLVEECLALWRNMQNRVGQAYALYTLAEIVWAQGEHERAKHLMEQALAGVRDGGDTFATGIFGARLTHLLLLDGEFEQALAFEQQNLSVRWANADHWGVAESLSGIAWAAVRLGAAERAAVLLGAADALWRTIGSTILHRYRDEQEQARRAALDALGEDAFSAAWAAGQACSMADAVAYGLRPIGETRALPD